MKDNFKDLTKNMEQLTLRQDRVDDNINVMNHQILELMGEVAKNKIETP